MFRANRHAAVGYRITAIILYPKSCDRIQKPYPSITQRILWSQTQPVEVAISLKIRIISGTAYFFTLRYIMLRINPSRSTSYAHYFRFIPRLRKVTETLMSLEKSSLLPAPRRWRLIFRASDTTSRAWFMSHTLYAALQLAF